MNNPNSPGGRPKGAETAGSGGDPEATAVLEENAFQPDAEALAQSLKEAQAKADENFSQYLRVLAEFDNFRKRAARDLEAVQRYAIERFAQELIPAIDGFELALANAAGADAKSLLEGQPSRRGTC